MTDAEARALLGVGPGPAAPAQIRDAYLRRAQDVRVDVDPAALMGLREAFELMARGAGAPFEEIAAARDGLAAQPDAEDARWRLLSYLPYAAGPEAASVLRDGAERRPEAFVDELLFHFPEKVPGELLRRARDGAGVGRLLLIADVEATEGRPAQALEALRAALGDPTTVLSGPFFRLAARPIFSLQVHAQTKPAAEALALLQAKMGVNNATGDLATVTMFRVALELAQLDDTFPLDLRQVAARAAKRGDFQNAPYEARFAARLMKPLEVSALNGRLARDAPTLAGILGLSLTEDQLRPNAMPNIKMPTGWGTYIALTLLFGSVAFRDCNRTQNRDRPFEEKLAAEAFNQTAEGTKERIVRDCADLGSRECRRWTAFVPDWTSDADPGGAAPEPAGRAAP